MDLSSVGNSYSWFLIQIALQCCKSWVILPRPTDSRNKNKKIKHKSNIKTVAKPCVSNKGQILDLVTYFILSLILLCLFVLFFFLHFIDTLPILLPKRYYGHTIVYFPDWNIIALVKKSM